MSLLAAAAVVLAAVLLLPRGLGRFFVADSSRTQQPAQNNGATSGDKPSNPPTLEHGTHRDATTLTEVGTVPELNARSWEDIDDPAKDGWDTEAFSAEAMKQLKHIGGLVTHPGQISAPAVAEIVVPDFSAGSLRPTTLSTVFQDQALLVKRYAGKGKTEPSVSYQGAEGLAEVLLELAAPFHDASDIRFKFKLFRVEAQGETVVTRQYFAISGSTETGLVEENAEWVAHWIWNAGAGKTGKGAPKLQSIEVTEFEQVESQQSAPLFADCTASLLGHNPSYQDQLLYGYNYWLERIQDKRAFHLFGAPGVALGDVNGDGLEDLYICQEGGLPNRLFRQNSDGTLDDISSTSGTDWLDSTRSALLVDLDNDGDQDLVAAVLGCIVVAENNGQGRFLIVAVLPTPKDTFSLRAADYDSDADLDLYVCGYQSDDLADESGILSVGRSTERFVYHNANTGARNILFRNDSSETGNWQFTDATEQVGLDVNNRRFSFAAAWEDFDNDGDQDLYVANDFGLNNLYENVASEDGTRRFVDIAARAGVEDSASGMSVTWGDFDLDGWMDIYVSNMFSAAGGRISYQDRFKAEAPGVKQRLQRFARGNTLFRNAGDGTFEDVSIEAGVNVGRWAWSSNFLDMNNDGFEDLIVANGFISTEDSGDL